MADLAKRPRNFEASLTFAKNGGQSEEKVPIRAYDLEEAKELVFQYAIQVLKLRDFELTLVGF